jgi:hypothetical protein
MLNLNCQRVHRTAGKLALRNSISCYLLGLATLLTLGNLAVKERHLLLHAVGCPKWEAVRDGPKGTAVTIGKRWH